MPLLARARLLTFKRRAYFKTSAAAAHNISGRNLSAVAARARECGNSGEHSRNERARARPSAAAPQTAAKGAILDGRRRMQTLRDAHARARARAMFGRSRLSVGKQRVSRHHSSLPQPPTPPPRAPPPPSVNKNAFAIGGDGDSGADGGADGAVVTNGGDEPDAH